jgi:hypothetical protein
MAIRRHITRALLILAIAALGVLTVLALGAALPDAGAPGTEASRLGDARGSGAPGATTIAASAPTSAPCARGPQTSSRHTAGFPPSACVSDTRKRGSGVRSSQGGDSAQATIGVLDGGHAANVTGSVDANTRECCGEGSGPAARARGRPPPIAGEGEFYFHSAPLRAGGAGQAIW